jgi:hypothetical protein
MLNLIECSIREILFEIYVDMSRIADLLSLFSNENTVLIEHIELEESIMI